MNGFGRGENKKTEGRTSILTRETVGITLLLFGGMALLITATGRLLFSDFGMAIAGFFIGTFGFFSYPLLVFLMYGGVVLAFGKRLFSAKWFLRIFLVVLAVFFIVHTATAERFAAEGYGKYLASCFYAAGSKISSGTGGGAVLGVIAYPVRMLSVAGAYIVFSALLVLALWYLLLGTPLKSRLSRVSREPVAPKRVRTEGERAYPGGARFDELPQSERTPAPHTAAEEAVPSSPVRPAPLPRRPASAEHSRSYEVLYGDDPTFNFQNNLIYDSESAFNTRERRSSMEPQSPAPRPQSTPVGGESYQGSYSAQAEEPRPAMPRRVATESAPVPESGYSYRPEEPTEEDINYTQRPSYRAPSPEPAPRERDYYANDVTPAQPEEEVYEEPAPEEPPVYRRPEPAPEEPVYRRSEPAAEEESSSPSSDDRVAQFRSLFSGSASRTPAAPAESESAEEPFERRTPRVPAPSTEEDEPLSQSRIFESPMSSSDLFDGDGMDEEPPQAIEPPVRRSAFAGRGERAERASSNFVPPMSESQPAPTPKKHRAAPYVRPNIDILREYDSGANVPQEEIESNSQIIVDTLAGFRVDAEVVNVTCGSAVTRYDLDVPKNIAVGTVLKRDEEIAMRLNARDGVNMYVNREHGVISVEVPNVNRGMVGLRSVLESPAYRNPKPGSLVFGIGKTVDGANVCGDIVAMKHLLVAGATGSGKSVCLNALLISLICKYSPEDMRLILVDPKKVEFTAFEGLPHLMINEIISDAQKAVMAFNWAIKEMERRYELFRVMTQGGTLVREIDEYNANVDPLDKLPKIVIVVDELADLMLVAKKDIEDRIQRLTQKARAAGIHVVLATQRPSVNVITGVIKSNLPTRIAFRVVAEVDSRTILDETGAHKLLGKGDMLYTMENVNCRRVQGAFLSSQEVQEIVEQIKGHNEAYYDESVQDFINKPAAASSGGDEDEGGADDENVPAVYIKALAIVVKLHTASISLIQRRCSVGYSHAGKIIEWMERLGYISPFEGKSKPRDVLLTEEEFESRYGDIDAQ